MGPLILVKRVSEVGVLVVLVPEEVLEGLVLPQTPTLTQKSGEEFTRSVAL